MVFVLLHLPESFKDDIQFFRGNPLAGIFYIKLQIRDLVKIYLFNGNFDRAMVGKLDGIGNQVVPAALKTREWYSSGSGFHAFHGNLFICGAAFPVHGAVIQAFSPS